MIGSRSEIARLQSDFYRDQFRKVVRWLIVSVMLMFILILMIVYFILFQPTQDYYANTSEGRILDMPSTK
jgi:amino acid permease